MLVKLSGQEMKQMNEDFLELTCDSLRGIRITVIFLKIQHKQVSQGKEKSCVTRDNFDSSITP